MLLASGSRANLTLAGSLFESAAGSAYSIEPCVLTIGSEEHSLTVVINPFGRALFDGVDLNANLAADPEEGNRLLDQYVAQTARELRAVSEGLVYVLEGARAEFCSPMQYGGFYLERDRELLSSVPAVVTRVLLVPGGEDVFLDFVSDLPAEVFAWDSRASGFSSEYVRGMRQGLQASEDPGSEIQLVGVANARFLGQKVTLV